MNRQFVILAAVFGFLGVATGAFGTHGLRPVWEARPDDRDVFQTGTAYHLIHAAALIGAATVYGAVAPAGKRWARAAGWLFTAGIMLFSGSLYILSVFDVRFMGAVAPVGGAALVAGWASLGMAGVRGL